MRDLISLTDLDESDLAAMVARGVEFGAGAAPASLADRAVGLLFPTTSTRTRTSFWRAATRLGAAVITFGPGELQLATGETMTDTAKVLAAYLDVLVARTNGPVAEMRALATASPLGVVNALTEDEHPTQAIADLITIKEEFGELSGRHLLYLGEGNSTAAALAYATALTPGLRLSVVTPVGYALPPELLAGLRDGGRVVTAHDLDEVRDPVDVVYTSRWQTMGVAKAVTDWKRDFRPFAVTREIFERFRGDGTVFLHDLPAVRGEEVTDDVLDGPESRAWRQAYHKMTGAMAILEWCARDITAEAPYGRSTAVNR